jgi:hypothetical protein
MSCWAATGDQTPLKSWAHLAFAAAALLCACGVARTGTKARTANTPATARTAAGKRLVIAGPSGLRYCSGREFFKSPPAGFLTPLLKVSSSEGAQ